MSDPWKLEIYVGVGDDCKVAEVMHNLTGAELLEEIHTALEIPVVSGIMAEYTDDESTPGAGTL